MNVRNACLGAGLLLSLGVSIPADAADWGNGGGSSRDYSRGATAVPAVPVPAPVPIPEYRGGWYIRLDAGVGVIGEPSLSESGYKYGEWDGIAGAPGTTAGPDLLSLNSSWFSSDFDTFATVGGGVGYDFGHGWRVDATVEKRLLNVIQIGGTDSWESWKYDPQGTGSTTYGLFDNSGPTGSPDGKGDLKTTIHIDDKTKLDGTIWMLNAYYDLFTTRGFTPYIGAGAGVMWNVISRRHKNDITRCDTTGTPPCDTQVPVSSTDVAQSVDKATFAGAAMAGVSYELTETTSLDIGYRYLYMGGTEISLDIPDSKGNLEHSRLKIGDQGVHQVRAGVRFNFN